MKKNLGWKVILIIVTLLVFVWGFVLGTDPQRSLQAIKQQGLIAGIQQNIHLGLDLKGGTHLILQVMVNDAVNADSDQVVERLKQEFRTQNVTYSEISKPDTNNPDHIVIKGVPPDASGTLRTITQERFPEYDLSSSGDGFAMAMKAQKLTELKKSAVAQAIETIRNRIDQLGVSEPVIQEHGLGEHQILVQLPGVDDPARVKDIMQSTAMLEIRQALQNGAAYPTREAAMAAVNGVLPTDAVILPGVPNNSASAGPDGSVYYIISRVSAVSGRDLKDAQPGRDGQNGQPEVSFHLTNEGGQKFYNFTSAHVGDYLAVVLDGRVREVASIREPIRDNGQISGNMTDQQTKDLSLTLRSGALPAGIRYLQESTVGPSLGADSIRDGVRASVIGMIAVLVFMLVYYRGAGINADLALILNLIILLGFLGFSGATLTLPGIAGLILTVGMGVDSNVLIFERIREELRNGKTPPSAVEQGFGHAWLTIVDTHVTTIVSALILFLFGTGPVKGFAVTLTFGLLANLFTAVFVSRVIFDSILNRHQRGEALSI
jgi:preprotein translocase subunit SecD